MYRTFSRIQFMNCEKAWRNYILSMMNVQAKSKYGITVSLSDEFEESFSSTTESKWVEVEVSQLRNGKIIKRFGFCVSKFQVNNDGLCHDSIVTRKAREWFLDYIRQINSLFIGHYRTFNGLYIYDRKKFENSDDYGMVYVSRDDDGYYNHVSHDDDIDCSCVGRGCEVCLPMY
jgi:hypothetical protein